MTAAKLFGWSDRPSVSMEFSSHGPWTLKNKGLYRLIYCMVVLKDNQRSKIATSLYISKWRNIKRGTRTFIIFKSCYNIFKKFWLIDVQYTFDRGTMVSITGPFCSVHYRMAMLCLEVVSFLSDGEQISF